MTYITDERIDLSMNYVSLGSKWSAITGTKHIMIKIGCYGTTDLRDKNDYTRTIT
jgi:hypothetical protein